MNEELTREVLEAMAKCGNCTACGAIEFCSKYDWKEMTQALATALLEERAKPKVWDGAPEWATNGRVYWTNGCNKDAYSKLYRREIPKTRARQIAENIVHGMSPSAADDIKYVEGILTKYAEELTNTKETN